MPDGSAITFWGDAARTVEELRSRNVHDADAFVGFDQKVRAIASFLAYVQVAIPPDPKSPSFADAIMGLKLGKAFRDLGAKTGREAVRALPMAVADLVQEVFELEPVRGPLCTRGVLYTAMGAWATGMNMGIALSKVCMVKSTGPDIEKIVDTLERFGDGYDYLICAYPPFLKHVADALDARGFDWSRSRVYGLVGGEAMTEAMRDYLEQRFVKVRSGYGASDIQIGIGGETDLSVHLRKLLVTRADVREALLGPGESRVPMVFQYNPLESYIEINARGESVITVNNASVLSPKLRYNVGDEARVIDRRTAQSRLASLGIDGPFPAGWHEARLNALSLSKTSCAPASRTAEIIGPLPGWMRTLCARRSPATQARTTSLV